MGYFATQPARNSTISCGTERFAVDRVFLGFLVEQFGRGHVQRNRNLLARLVARLLNRLDNQIQRLGIAAQIGSKAAFVADVRVQLFGFEHAFQMMKRFHAGPQRIAELRETQRHDHELLHVDGVVGMRPAVDDVHHRRRQQPRSRPAQIPEQRQAAKLRRGMGHRPAKRREWHSRRDSSCFRVPSISIIRRSMPGLIERIVADQFLGQFFVDIRDGFVHRSAQKLRLVAIAQFPGFMHAGAGAAGHRGAAKRAIGQCHIDFNRRIAAAIENLPAMNCNNFAHDRIQTLRENTYKAATAGRAARLTIVQNPSLID